MVDSFCLVMTGIGIIAGLVLAFIGFLTFRNYRFMTKTETSPIDQVKPGIVEVKGKTMPLIKMKSPLTDQDCVYYTYKIEELRRGHKGRSYWATVKRGSSYDPFYLMDQTGIVRVNPVKAKTDLALSFKDSSGFMNDPSPNAQRFLGQMGISSTNFIGMNRRMRFSESVIKPNQAIYVLGTALGWHSGGKDQEKFVIQKGGFMTPFLLTTKSEEQLVKKYLLHFILWWTGAGLTIVGSILMFLYYGFM